MLEYRCFYNNLFVLLLSTASDRYQQQAIIPIESETHAADDVGIWADGPMAHLFHSVHEQSYIMHAMAYASCLDQFQMHCSAA